MTYNLSSGDLFYFNGLLNAPQTLQLELWSQYVNKNVLDGRGEESGEWQNIFTQWEVLFREWQNITNIPGVGVILQLVESNERFSSYIPTSPELMDELAELELDGIYNGVIRTEDSVIKNDLVITITGSAAQLTPTEFISDNETIDPVSPEEDLNVVQFISDNEEINIISPSEDLQLDTYISDNEEGFGYFYPKI